MRRRVIFIIALSAIFFQGLMPSAWAGSEPKTYSWQDKLLRGFLNIVSSPIEVAVNIHNTTEEKNILIGWTFGLLKGLGNGFLRFGAGVVDLVTFPFNFPEENKAPLIDPEYVWEKPGPQLV